MREVINGFLKAAGWGTTAAVAGVAGAGLFGAGVVTGARAQRKIVRAVVGSAMGNHPVEPKVEEPMKTAGWPMVLGAAGLVGAGAVGGAKLQRGLGRGPIMKADSFRSQARQKQLERQGSFVS